MEVPLIQQGKLDLKSNGKPSIVRWALQAAEKLWRFEGYSLQAVRKWLKKWFGFSRGGNSFRTLFDFFRSLFSPRIYPCQH